VATGDIFDFFSAPQLPPQGFPLN